MEKTAFKQWVICMFCPGKITVQLRLVLKFTLKRTAREGGPAHKFIHFSQQLF